MQHTIVISTEDQNRVKSSWRILRVMNPAIVGEAFYTKLFTDYPELKRMFPKDMTEQYIKLMDMLSSMVIKLNNPEGFYTEVVAMGMRHAGYGVQPHHYDVVGAALLWTLEKGLGADWNIEIREAWSRLYGKVSAIMIEARKGLPAH